MSATFIGLESLFLTQLSHTQNSDRSIIVTAVQKISPFEFLEIPILGDVYVYIGISVKVTNVTIDKTSGEFVVVTTQLEGAGNSDNESPFQQESIGSISEEPIQTHPNFSSILAAAGETGVKFDDSNNFVGFTKSATGGLCGVQSYLSPTLSYRRTFTTTTTPSLVNVGKIYASDALTDFPVVTSGASWLLTSISFVSKSGVLNVNEDYRASDSKGWNPYIYLAAEA